MTYFDIILNQGLKLNHFQMKDKKRFLLSEMSLDHIKLSLLKHARKKLFLNKFAKPVLLIIIAIREPKIAQISDL